jgi:tetratricopeptide (TPR) repeat protein
MRIAALFALVFLLAPSLYAQTRRLSTPTQDQDNNDRAIDLSDPLIFLRAHSDSDPRSPVNGSSIPVSQLRIPSKAVKEVERSQKAFQTGDLRASAEHLEKAVSIYPDFLQAHNILGARYIKLGEYEKGLAEYQTALSIDPNLAEIYHNLAVALFFLGRYPEAESAARRALERSPNEPATRYVLGRILVMRGRKTPEMMETLRQSERQFPNASLVLAKIYYDEGQTDQVITELRAYLKAPEADNKSKAECWLAQLTHESTATCTTASTPPDFH